MKGPPAPSKKISLSHVNKDFKVKVQVDFTYFEIRRQVYPELHVDDTGNGFSEVRLVKSQRDEDIMEQLNAMRIYVHGAQEFLSADDEFNRNQIRKDLQTRLITFKPRPTRRHIKCGIIEGKMAPLKEYWT